MLWILLFSCQWRPSKDATTSGESDGSLPTQSFEGIGLGLYISKNIIETHGGKIWAGNNSDDGKGTIFRFTLPIQL